MNDNPYSEEINRLALKKIARANESLSLSGEIKTFDYSSKTVTTASASMFSVGGSYIEFYWNFARVYLSAYIVNYIIQALEAIVSGVLVNHPVVDGVLEFFLILECFMFKMEFGLTSITSMQQLEEWQLLQLIILGTSQFLSQQWGGSNG